MDFIILFFNQIHIDSFEYPLAMLMLLLPILFFGIVYFGQGRFEQRIKVPSLKYHVSSDYMMKVKHRIGIYRSDIPILMRSRRVWTAIIAAILIFSCYVCLTIAIAHPYGGATDESRTEGIDIYFSLDMSASMKAYDYTVEQMQARYVMDVETPNRFDIAKMTIRNFIQSRQKRCNDSSGVIARCDRIGIAMFGQHAFIDMPMTINYDELSAQLLNRRIDDIDASQSAIGDGIMVATASLRHSDSKSRNIILVSDGDRKGGRISISQAVAAAKEYGVRIFPVMIGNSDRAVLAEPNYDGYLTFHEAQFPVNFELLTDIAAQTGGVAYRASSDEDFQKMLEEVLELIEPHISVDSRSENQVDLSRHFIILAFLFAIMAYIIYVTAVEHYT